MNRTKTLILKQFHKFSKEEQIKIIWKNFSTYPDYDWWDDIDVNDRVSEAKEWGFNFGKIQEFDLDRGNYIKIDFDFNFKKFITCGKIISKYYPLIFQITSKRNLLWYYNNGYITEVSNPCSYSKFDNILDYILEFEPIAKETANWKPDTIEKLNKAIEYINKLAQEALTNFCNEVLSQLRKEYEWLTSIESIDDLCKANNYWFDPKSLKLITPDEIIHVNPNIGNWFDNGFTTTLS